ncbi:penicillin-binding transpeptidase domain-containing protein [Geobacillus sp. FJAT-46040]|uniref:penicillin-binding transpeptidase domain-containing protein n=1 Tax=Geobacillus sp. FJAT-46040 TaxID=2011017 RepID=UPI00350F082C
MRQTRRRRCWLQALVVAALALAAVVAALEWAIDRQNIAALETPLPAATIIYDEHGRIASKLAAANIEEVPIDRVPNYFLEAIVATEDRRFYEHDGHEAIAQYGLTQSDVLSGGLRIYTELDPNMQQALEAVYANDSLFPSSPDGVPVQSGAVLLDPKTGGVKALVGGRGRHVFRGFNRATELRRQPGSTLKPLAVYTPALEQGYGPFSLLKDEPLNLGGYRPQNYDHTHRGTVTMYEAIIHFAQCAGRLAVKRNRP